MEQKNKKKISTQTIIKLLLAVVLLGLSAFLLKGDVWTFWTWWLLAGVIPYRATCLATMVSVDADRNVVPFTMVKKMTRSTSTIKVRPFNSVINN